MTQGSADAEIAWQKANAMEAPQMTGDVTADSRRFLALYAIDEAAFRAVE